MNSSTPQIDLYGLHLLRLVAEHRSITAAAKQAGLSQSAMTRQVQTAEARLGIQLFERTTRKLRLTEAGAVLLRETAAIPNILDGALRRIEEDYLGGEKTIRIGISRGLALSHLPGIFHAQQREHPEVKVLVSQPSGPALLRAVEQCELDLAILTRPAVLPSAVRVSHTMEDVFCLLTSSRLELPKNLEKPAGFRKWAAERTWILPPIGTETRGLIDRWADTGGLSLSAHTELDNFDLMAQMVALRMGVALVPRRILSSFRRRSQLQLSELPRPLRRTLVVALPKRPNVPTHVKEFVDSILFS